jgi:hypothetical protein
MKVQRRAISQLACATMLAGMSATPATEPFTIAPVTYDRSWPSIGYAAGVAGNPVADLPGRLQRGEVKLTWEAPRGYLDSLLEALDISPASQVLVFSRTSLQAPYIGSGTPRAIYFNDHTYVAWVQGSQHMEVLTIDGRRGPLFFTIHNAPGKPLALERESLRCMACHDSAALQPGGIPRVLLLSSPVEPQANPPSRTRPVEVTHAMAIEDRWGGWFVTGSLGAQLHVGNLPLAGMPDPAVRNIHNRSNLAGLQDYIDATPYITDKSDVVALLVLEHQAYVQNLITRVHYEAAAQEGTAKAQRWSALPARQQAALQPALDQLVVALTFQDERRLLGRIRGGAGFEGHFTARGPADAQGRTLRDFDLRRRTFRHPLSYLLYSEQFDELPAAIHDYIYERIVAAFGTPSGDETLDAERGAALQILSATKPAFAAWQGLRSR